MAVQHASPVFQFPAVGLPAAHRGLRAAVLFGAAVVHARKPVEIIRDELWDHEDPDAAAEDVVSALEEAGWRLVFVPDADLEAQLVA